MALIDQIAALATRVGQEIKSVRSVMALDSTVVHRSGDETVSGIKTFGSAPVVPAGTLAGNPIRYDDTSRTNARTPTAHKNTHAAGGSDALAPADIGAQPSSSNLTTIAGLAPSDGTFIKRVAGAWAAAGLSKSDVGLGSVDNTSDAAKPVSDATQNAINQVYNSVADGIIARVRRTSNSTGTGNSSTSTAQPVLRLAANVVAGRIYRVKLQAGFIGTAACVIGAQITYTTNGAAPGVTSTQLGLGYVSVGAGVTETKPLDFYYFPTTAHTFTVLLSHWRQNSSGTVTLQGNASMPMDLVIEDVGPDVGSTGTAL